MSLAMYFGVLAGFLHLVGFVFYAGRIRTGEVMPHGASWAMRCYGAMVHFLIFAEIGMPPAILIQPAISGLCALTITLLALGRGAWLRPTRIDMRILAADLALLLVYAVLRHVPPDLQSASLVQGVLAVTVVRKLVPYLPILRLVAVNPRAERPAAWAIWALGYMALFCAASLTAMGPVYTIYPVAVCVVHVAIWALVTRGSSRISLPESPGDMFRLVVTSRSPSSVLGPHRLAAFPPFMP